jgi:hypothetical protein
MPSASCRIIGPFCDALVRMFHCFPCDLFRSFELRNLCDLIGMQCLERGVANSADGFVRQPAQYLPSDS